jgi:signal transduction histidine kinase/DNA-binding LacI/PurR family transcriptional regulator/AraC-like DNA-binding protein
MKSQTFPTIGLLSTWPLYWGTTVDRYAHEMMKGVCAAANDRRCNLLLGVGISPGDKPLQRRAAWPVQSTDTDFVPVGPWNTDGLIILPDGISPEQSRYVSELQASLPVVFTTTEGPGPRVVVDNSNGIREAVWHLVQHGHRRIAFVAGNRFRAGDSADRLRAFKAAMEQFGAGANPRLIAHGEHSYAAGGAAMRQILASGANFTAFVASNDLSCLGAIDALREAGLRVPDDVAAIGFDDILDARSVTPSLTTVRHPTFALGYRAVEALLDLISGRSIGSSPVVVPTRLIVRQSCGCGRAQFHQTQIASGGTEMERLAALSSVMAEAAYVQAHQSTVAELDDQSRTVVRSLIGSLGSADGRLLRGEIARLLSVTEARGEDPSVWQSAVSALYRCSDALVDAGTGVSERAVMTLLDQARIDISEHVQRSTAHALLAHMDMMSELGFLTSQLLAVDDIAQIAPILDTHLPRVGIEHFLIAMYHRDDEDDPVGRSEIVITTGLTERGEPFASRDFPPSDLYPSDEPFQLSLLPVRVGDATVGFAAMSTTNLEPAAAIVNNLGAAIRAVELHRQALEGRRLAEDANQLKSRFLSMVSHELRTPLSLVVGLSDMILRETREGGVLSADAARDLEHMSASAQHLGRLIGDVLDLANSQVGQLHLVRQQVDLCEVLFDAALAGEQMAREKGLEWRARIPAAISWVMGDRTRLSQVILNLVGNAIKFTDAGSVTMEAVVADGEVTVSVSDTGVGIPADELGSVFDEFHRSPEAIRQGLSGMGLGLAIARQLVARHGGSIGVRSPGVNGLGTTFWFTLPVVAPDSLGLDVRDERPDVLLIASAGASERWLEEHLHERGFAVRVEHVDPTRDWSGVFEAGMPSAVILDDTVAGGRGWEYVRATTRGSELLRIPVLACRLEPDGDRGGFLDLTYLLKPLQAAELADELGRRNLVPSSPARAPVILIVDDDPATLEFHARVIRSAGARPIRARSGSEAMVLMAESRPDLVLLDLVMPGMDGFEVLEAMQANDITRDIPVIVVTGRDMGEDELGRLNGHVASILGKGVFTSQEIVGRIEAVLSGAPALGAATQRLIRRATAYIEAQYAEPIGREDIARHVAITPDYLTYCFHQELGITPITFLTRYRIRRAKEMLEDTELRVTEIAMATGFSAVSHFTRTFHKEVGVSPRVYRRGRRPQAVRSDSPG